MWILVRLNLLNFQVNDSFILGIILHYAVIKMSICIRLRFVTFLPAIYLVFAAFSIVRIGSTVFRMLCFGFITQSSDAYDPNLGFLLLNRLFVNSMIMSIFTYYYH
jgi:hypothetical protein